MTTIDPIAEFEALFAEARKSETGDATAVSLGTTTPDGRPSVRIVLLKGVDARGFIFFTNYESRKAGELDANPHAALCFHWPSLTAQVRVEGDVERVTREESEAYFRTRPRESQLGAWASRQSRPLRSRYELMSRFVKTKIQYVGRDVPCPEFWGGYRVIPHTIELWRGLRFRLHDRRVYTRRDGVWSVQQLFP